MKLIVGLGNPRPEYFATRHNAGFLVVDELQKIKLPKGTVVKKSGEFMNRSGEFVKELVKRYGMGGSDLFIVHDDLDIPLGAYKIQFGKGPKDHNGTNSVDESLGTNEYWHVRVGVDNRSQDNRQAGEEYVLLNFSDAERKILDGTIKEICKKLATLLKNTS